MTEQNFGAGVIYRDVVANLLNCDVVNDLEFHSRYYVHFRTDTFKKNVELHYPSTSNW